MQRPQVQGKPFMKQVVIENPVINSPFEEPQRRDHLLNDHLITERKRQQDRTKYLRQPSRQGGNEIVRAKSGEDLKMLLA
jgi:hypothetical protein